MGAHCIFRGTGLSRRHSPFATHSRKDLMKKLLITATLAALVATPSLGSDLVDKGEKVFKKCKACHMVGDNAQNKVGPELNDLFGRTAGGLDTYNYDKAMTEAGANGLVWTPASFDEFIKNPKKMIPGTKMGFPGLKKDKDVAAITAYLMTFSPNYKAE